MEITHRMAVAKIGRELDRKRPLDVFEKVDPIEIAAKRKYVVHGGSPWMWIGSDIDIYLPSWWLRCA